VLVEGAGVEGADVVVVEGADVVVVVVDDVVSATVVVVGLAVVLVRTVLTIVVVSLDGAVVFGGAGVGAAVVVATVKLRTNGVYTNCRWIVTTVDRATQARKQMMGIM